MASDSFWHKWWRRLLALFFIAQYHFRMSFLTLRFKARSLTRVDIDAHARMYWHNLCQAYATHIIFTKVLKNAQQKLESERVQTALHSAKQRLEKAVFSEETPTRQLDVSPLKTAWHALETSKIPRIVPNKLKTVRSSFETGTLPSSSPEKLKAARKMLKALRRPKITLFTLGVLLIALFGLGALVNQTLVSVGSIGITTVPQFITSALNPAAHRMLNINASKY